MLKKLNNLVPVFILLFIVIGCNTQEYSKTVIINNDIEFEIPSDWEHIVINGIDSENLGYLITNSNDSIYYEYGSRVELIRGNLLAVLPIESKINFEEEELAGSIFRFSKNPELDQALGVFLNEYYYYDTLQNNLSVIVQLPKKNQKGYVGLYTDFIDNKRNKLVVKGKNLDYSNQAKLLRIFKSIKIKGK